MLIGSLPKRLLLGEGAEIADFKDCMQNFRDFRMRYS